mmetsp:Transcript_53294/g.121373  ORF Transcript_53294/g.121373 Transcript_53294/m.121373 type:complete len:209 (-) Transcript_53294:188-814(-)
MGPPHILPHVVPRPAGQRRQQPPLVGHQPAHIHPVKHRAQQGVLRDELGEVHHNILNDFISTQLLKQRGVVANSRGTGRRHRRAGLRPRRRPQDVPPQAAHNSHDGVPCHVRDPQVREGQHQILHHSVKLGGGDLQRGVGLAHAFPVVVRPAPEGEGQELPLVLLQSWHADGGEVRVDPGVSQDLGVEEVHQQAHPISPANLVEESGW